MKIKSEKKECFSLLREDEILPWTVVYGGLSRDLISISNGSLALMGFPELTNQLIHTWFNPVLFKQQQIYPEPYTQPGTQLRLQNCYFWPWPKPKCVKAVTFLVHKEVKPQEFWQTCQMNYAKCRLAMHLIFANKFLIDWKQLHLWKRDPFYAVVTF